ncbi:hypothetical protein C8R46DRAFT_1029700 [Mycena filopes]|nr:hypothetical protein C8R46DRAFT_1029700 [Mycena filopes]
MTNHDDLASAFGFESIPAAAAFAIVYLPLFGWFVRQSIKNTTYVYISLTVFCLMRVAAFTLRAILIASATLGDNKSLLITAEVMFGVGFFALLYSAFTLVLDREIVAGGPPRVADSGPLKILRNRRLFRVVLLIGVVLGVSGIDEATSDNPSTAARAVNTRRASTIVFLVLTLVQALQTGLALNEPRRMYSSTMAARRWGDRHGRYILCFISLFLIVREVFQMATIGNAARQAEEKLWYPFIALPELFAVCLYAISGLVPTRAELKKPVGTSQEFEYIQA